MSCLNPRERRGIATAHSDFLLIFRLIPILVNLNFDFSQLTQYYSITICTCCELTTSTEKVTPA